MKKVTVAVIILIMLMAVTAFSAEVVAPGKANTGSIGTAAKPWANGYFTTLQNPRYTVASKDWGSTTGTWTLSATEQRAMVLYMKSGSGTGSSIVAPSEEGRVYYVFNNSGYAVTIKKASGTGVSIANGKVAAVMYFTSSATTDYMRLTADESF